VQKREKIRSDHERRSGLTALAAAALLALTALPAAAAAGDLPQPLAALRERRL
jgi:hypothetical protein